MDYKALDEPSDVVKPHIKCHSFGVEGARLHQGSSDTDKGFCQNLHLPGS